MQNNNLADIVLKDIKRAIERANYFESKEEKYKLTICMNIELFNDLRKHRAFYYNISQNKKIYKLFGVVVKISKDRVGCRYWELHKTMGTGRYIVNNESV